MRSEATWRASSRVGVRTRARGFRPLSWLGASLSAMGRAKARVLPVPVRVAALPPAGEVPGVLLAEALAPFDFARGPLARLLVLRGRGKHFCAGGDLGWMQEAATLDFNGNLADARNLAELLYNLYQLKKPTLAVVQGAAFGGAVGLVSCCDMAIGADNALFSLSEVRIGLMPATSIASLISETTAKVFASEWRRLPTSRARFRKARATSPVPPATSISVSPGWGFSQAIMLAFQILWTPADMRSFIRSYLPATDANTPLTRRDFSSRLTSSNPKETLSSSMPAT